MKNLEILIQDLETKIERHEMVNITVSTSSVGWQIEHCFLVINKITLALQNPRIKYKWKLNIKKILVLDVFKTIPRGKGKAPNQVKPSENKSLVSINQELILAKESIKLLQTLDKNLFFEHPYFGHLKVQQTKKFLAIHTNHHLKIIDDIINAK